MTVRGLIKKLEKMPQDAKIAVDVSYNNTDEFDIRLVDLSPTNMGLIEMHHDWRMSYYKGDRMGPKYIHMVSLGNIVGNYLE